MSLLEILPESLPESLIDPAFPTSGVRRAMSAHAGAETASIPLWLTEAEAEVLLQLCATGFATGGDELEHDVFGKLGRLLRSFRPVAAEGAGESLRAQGRLLSGDFQIVKAQFREGEEVRVRVRVSGAATLYVYTEEEDGMGESRDEYGLCVRFTAPVTGAYFLLLCNSGERALVYTLTATTGFPAGSGCPYPGYSAE